MARAYGSHAQMLLKFESSYGVDPGGNYIQVPFISSNLGSEQGLIENDVLGYGRDPQAPIRDVINANGDIVIPVDVRNTGLWLKGLLGDPTSGDNNAEGYIYFTVNPSPSDTITINGVEFTFVASGATGPQINVGGSLSATLDNAVTVLNASSDDDVNDATYSHASGSQYLEIVHDTAGSAGDSFTLAASAATVSGATLTGGSAKQHVYVSGANSLPSLAVEPGLSQVPAYFLNLGVVINSMAFEFVRSGGARCTVNCISQGEERNSSSQGGTPTSLALVRFNQFQGEIRSNGVRLGNVTRGTCTYSNNLEAVEVIRNDGKIEAADPTIAAMTGTIDVRFADTTLLSYAESGTAVSLIFEYKISNLQKLIITAHEVYLPKAKQPIEGPGGVQASYNWQASDNASAGVMTTVRLVNDQTDY